MPCFTPDQPIDNHNSELAQALCACMWDLEIHDMLEGHSQWQLDWWIEHKARDRQRLEIELNRITLQKYRDERIKRFTEYERFVLGHN